MHLLNINTMQRQNNKQEKIQEYNSWAKSSIS